MKVELARINEAVHFEATGSGSVKVHIDGSPEMGGEGMGVRPMELVLMALGSCSSFDLISILKKQRQILEDIKISVEADRAEAIPAVFKTIHITFILKGQIEEEKAHKAAELAVRKYCSVHDMLAEGGVKITHSIQINP